MIQEYLLLDDSEKEAIEQYKPEGVESILVSVDNGKCCFVRFSYKGDSEDAAKALSVVNEYICKNFHVTILASESSAYMNRRLYPYINRFEHCLRKLLYLKSAVNPNNNGNKNIHDLESQDFGQIFTLLFIDNSFESAIRDRIKKQNKEFFSKDQILAIINSVDENTLWDSLLGKDTVPTLRSKFNEVRSYRNDVMHSHYINWKQYNDMIKLFRKINEELRTAIEEIEGVEESANNETTFNQDLADALQVQQQLEEVVKEYYSNPTIQQLQKTLNEAISSTKIDIPPTHQELAELKRILKYISSTDTLI